MKNGLCVEIFRKCIELVTEIFGLKLNIIFKEVIEKRKKTN
jgi:hypothetical protein